VTLVARESGDDGGSADRLELSAIGSGMKKGEMNPVQPRSRTLTALCNKPVFFDKNGSVALKRERRGLPAVLFMSYAGPGGLLQ
jgi:hypothetical protein